MRRTLLLFAALALVLAACSSDTTSDTSTTTAPAETTTTSGDTTTTSEETTTSTAAVSGGSGGGDNCLVGDWVLDDEAFFEAVFEAAGDSAEGDFEFAPGEGDFTVSFSPDGTVDAVREDWGFTVLSDEGDFNIVIDGDQTGTWSTDGSTLSLDLEEAVNFEIRTSLVVDGQEVTLPQAPFDVPAEALSTSSEYDCNGDTLMVITPEFTSVFNRA